MKGEKELSGVPCRKSLIPLIRTPPLLPNHYAKALSSNTMTLEVRFQHKNFGGDSDIQSMVQLSWFHHFSHRYPEPNAQLSSFLLKMSSSFRCLSSLSVTLHHSTFSLFQDSVISHMDYNRNLLPCFISFLCLSLWLLSLHLSNPEHYHLNNFPQIPVLTDILQLSIL